MHSLAHRRARGLLATSLVAVLVSAGLTFAIPVAQAADAGTVAISDVVLKKAVNAALGASRLPDETVTVAEAQSLTSLSVTGSTGVADLTGLEAFTRLASLSVTGDRSLTDTSPLRNLPLRSLTIVGGAVQGTLGSIGAISTLSTLRLQDARIFDVAPLVGLRLRELWLPQNQLADISPLSQLPGLVIVDLSGNRITDVTPVSRLTSPSHLYLADNRIEDIAPLAGYANRLTVNSLTLNGNRIRDLSPLRPFSSRPSATGQSVYAGSYQTGGVEVVLNRADNDSLPIQPVDANEGTYDQVAGRLALSNPAAASIEISPNWKVHLSDSPTDPSVAGTAAIDQTLKATGGSVVKTSCEPSYQWQREGADLPGATGESYVAKPADIGNRLTVRVTCGGREGVSAPTASVIGATTAAPAIIASQAKQTGVVGDPTNPGIALTVGQTDAAGIRVDPSRLMVVATSTNPSVLPASGVDVAGSGSRRAVTFSPTSRGFASITFTVTGPDGRTSTTLFQYAASIRTTPTSRVLLGQGDSSTAIPAGEGYLFVADDERSEIGLYDPDVSGPAAWESETLLVDGEIDFEASARQGDKIWWFGSHGNKKAGGLESSRQAVYETAVSGTGRNARLTKTGSYQGLRTDLIAWDRSHGNRLGLAAATAEGVKPDLANGFNLEGAEFSPDGSELYLGLRSPVIEEAGKQMALIVPVKNLPALTSGKAAKAVFGEPILLDLDGHDIREIRKNDAGQYLIVSGTPGMWTPQSSQMLFAWTGHAEDPAVALTTEVTNDVEPFHTDNAGAWEGIGELPDNLTSGSQVRLIMDQGYDTLYNSTGENKKTELLLRKARTDVFTLTGNLGLSATVSGSMAFGEQAANTVGAPQSVTITNTGSERVRVGRVYVVGDDDQASDFLISQNTCAYTEPGPGSTCWIAVRFAPAKVSTTSKAQLVIESNLPGADRTVELSGISTTLPKGEPGKDGTDGAPGAPGAPGTIITKSVKVTVSVKALSSRRVQVAVTAKGLDRRLLNQKVTIKVAGARGSYVVRLTNGRGTIKLSGNKARKVRSGKRVRIVVSVPKLTRRIATSTTVTDYVVSKSSKRQTLKVRK